MGRLSMTTQKLIDDVLNDPTISHWLKSALNSALNRDLLVPPKTRRALDVAVMPFRAIEQTRPARATVTPFRGVKVCGAA